MTGRVTAVPRRRDGREEKRIAGGPVAVPADRRADRGARRLAVRAAVALDTSNARSYSRGRGGGRERLTSAGPRGGVSPAASPAVGPDRWPTASTLRRFRCNNSNGDGFREDCRRLKAIEGRTA